MSDVGEIESILNRVHEWTRAADEKLNIMVAVQALVLASLLPKVEDWWKVAGFWTQLGLLISLALLVSGVVFAVLALFPRIKSSQTPPSVTFFGDIASQPIDVYRERVRNMDDAALWEDHIRQIHRSSIIATAKFQRIRSAVLLFAGGVVVLAALRAAHGLR